MKKHAALMVIGGIMALIGLLVAVSGANLSPTSSQFEIPSGGDYYNVRDIYIPPGGELKVDFRVTSGTSVDFYVFTPAQYNDYQNDGSASSVAAASGPSGAITFKSSSGGTYHMVFDHGSGYASTVQKGTVNERVNGVNVPVLLGGVVVFALGLALTSYGLVIKKRETIVQPDWMRQKQTGVLYFKEGKPPKT